jgi:hypothetical protein
MERLFSPTGQHVSCLLLLTVAFAASPGVHAGRTEKSGHSLTIDLPSPSAKVVKVVEQVAGDGIIHGTSQYEREKTITDATVATSSDAFEPWEGPSQVFYKVKDGALAPSHFDDTGDIGTVTVRYVVEAVNPQLTRVRIDAVFIQHGRRRRHVSDGSVETSEFGEIATQLKALERQEQDAEAQRLEMEKQEQERTQMRQERDQEEARLAAATASLGELQKQAQGLRQQLLARVKSDGTPLRSAPFGHSASLGKLARGDQVTIVVRTPYWSGVLGPHGEKGWVHNSSLEPLP